MDDQDVMAARRLLTRILAPHGVPFFVPCQGRHDTYLALEGRLPAEASSIFPHDLSHDKRKKRWRMIGMIVMGMP